VVVRLHHPESEVLLDLDAVWIRRRGADGETLAEVRALAGARPLPDDGWLVTFEGLSTRNEAEALRGARIAVPRDRLPAPGPDEYFAEDLLDLHVLDPAGRPLGRVARVYENGALAVLVVEAAAVGEVDVPFVEEHVGEVDLERRTLVVRDLGLLIPEK
jgi:16S rRNA processing protein RimM